MEYRLDPENNSSSLENTVQAQASQSQEVQEKPDLHYDSVTGRVKDVPPQPSRNQRRQQSYRKATAEEEVVKFMSSVPGYLVRGEKPQEKVLNVGVLDWGLLEKWQCSKKQSTPSSDHLSSDCSTDGSSIDSTSRHSSSPPRERIRRLSLQYYMMASPIGGHPSAARPSEECAGKLQHPEAAKLVVTNPKISEERRAVEKKLTLDGEYARKEQMLQDRFVQRSAKASRISFSEICNEAYGVEVKSGIPHSCPLPCEANSVGGSHLEQPGSIDAESVKFPPALRHSVSLSANKGTELSKNLNMKASKAAVEKPRSTSPLLRFSIGMTKMSKSSGHKECLTALQFAPSSYISVKSCPENAVVSTARTRSSSPLKRLLDPLIKPKASNFHQLSEPSLRHYVSTDSTSRLSSNGLFDSSAVRLGKGKSAPDDASQGKKQRSSTFQALLRVAFKNGQPLFTFTLDNDSEILAATLKSSATEKEERRSIYTFFNIREVKRKRASWITQGGKEKGPNYIPDIVAQMKVFDVQPKSVDHFRVKEYVLFSVEMGEKDQGTSNFKPNDELAAIVVKMPKTMQRKSTGNGCESNNYNKLSGIRQYSYSGDNRQESISTTVILPSDAHSLPSKGEPSSLVHRWRSGGSCDCGGWDLGCKLKILANSNQQLTRKSCSSFTKDQFELFSQNGRSEEDQPALSLATFKNGVFSVEFNPSLSLLQAFSTCIAILDCWKPYELSFSSSDMFEEKASGETIQVRNGGTRVLKHGEENHPTKYVSFPPLSPVGRV